MATKRVVILSDFHCGHRAGLTPPYRWPTPESKHKDDDERTIRVRKHTERYRKLNEECWNWFTGELTKLKKTSPSKKIDACFFNGDAIDGKQQACGGSEFNAPTMIDQCDMATHILKRVQAEKYVLSYGTPYHVGKDTDWEDSIADRLGAVKIGSQVFPEVNGVTFDLKHEPAGNSNIPHGRHTGVAKDRMWNLMWWADEERQPRAQVYIRSHVHYHAYAGGPGWLAMTTPALQAASTKYGARRCVGMVDYGFVHFDIHDNGSYTWQSHVAKIKTEKVTKFSI